MHLDFSSQTLKSLTETQVIIIYKELLIYQKTGILEDGLLKETAQLLNRLSIRNTFSEELLKVELFCSITLAKKYITEHHL